MRLRINLFSILLFVLIKPVRAQNTQEFRISEHAVFSFIAVAGLITIAYLVRRKRKK